MNMLDLDFPDSLSNVESTTYSLPENNDNLPYPPPFQVVTVIVTGVTMHLLISLTLQHLGHIKKN